MRNKTLAGLLGFLLPVGIHRFYLGNIGLGIFFLLTCWLILPAVICMIDGIVILCSSQEAFDRKYNVLP